MAKEIERKFLIDQTRWSGGENGIYCRQGYLLNKPQINVRVRRQGDEAFLTIKANDKGFQRNEYEYKIPVADAEELLSLYCEKPVIEKTRFIEFFAGKKWEIDVFHGENEGLVIAEVELSTTDELVELPPWVVQEVTGVSKYYNSSLVKYPFKKW